MVTAMTHTMTAVTLRQVCRDNSVVFELKAKNTAGQTEVLVLSEICGDWLVDVLVARLPPVALAKVWP